MSYKRTLIFFIAFAVLAALYYFYEIRGGRSRREAERTEKLLLVFVQEDVTKIELQSRGETIVVQKDDTGWNMAEPVDAPADRSVVDQMVGALADLKYERDLGSQTDL